MSTDYQIRIQSPKDLSAEYFASIELEYKKLYRWQKRVITKALKKGKYGRDYITRFFSIQAPCGCGKTTVLIALAIYDIITSGFSQKQLEIVPQEHIGRGFSETEELKYISIQLGRKKYQWKVLEQHNLCLRDNKWDESKTKALKKWLLTPASELSKECNGGVISGLNAVCCYQSLVIVWKQLTEEEKERAITNLSLGVDEAHHLKNVYYLEEDFDSEEQKEIERQEATEIGKICSYIMNSKNKTAKIRTTSATMYRGDKKFIFSPSAKKEFINFNYTWAEHFKTLGIKEFGFAYEEYDDNPLEQMASNILDHPEQKHFVIFPSIGHKWRKSAHKELDFFISLLVKGGMKEDRILDLVTKRTQSQNKGLLLQEPKIRKDKDKSKFDVVIVCMLGREGTDWCPCDRLHNGASERTLTLAMQTIGRMLRRYKGKQEIIATTYIKSFVAPENVTSRELLSDRTNALLLCMQLNDSFKPFFFPVIPNDKEKSNKKTEKITLSDYLGDDYESIKEELLGRYEALENKEEESVKNMIHEILNEYNIKDNIESITAGLMIHISRLSVDYKKISSLEFEGMMNVKCIREGGFDKIRKYFKKDLYYGNYNEKDFPAIRRIVEKYFGVINCFTYEEACAEVIKMGFKNMNEYYNWKNKQKHVEASRDKMSA